jgi:hypothetical protein
MLFRFITSEATIVVIVTLLLLRDISTMTKSSPMHFQRWLRKFILPAIFVQVIGYSTTSSGVLEKKNLQSSRIFQHS